MDRNRPSLSDLKQADHLRIIIIESIKVLQHFYMHEVDGEGKGAWREQLFRSNSV